MNMSIGGGCLFSTQMSLYKGINTSALSTHMKCSIFHIKIVCGVLLAIQIFDFSIKSTQPKNVSQFVIFVWWGDEGACKEKSLLKDCFCTLFFMSMFTCSKVYVGFLKNLMYTERIWTLFFNKNITLPVHFTSVRM